MNPYTTDPNMHAMAELARTCQYCYQRRSGGYLISSCPDEHLQTIRICSACYDGFINGKNHLCVSCNKRLWDWSAKLDDENPYQKTRPHPWVLSWETTFGELYP